MPLKSMRLSPCPPCVWFCAPCALFRSLSPFELCLHTDLPKITRLKPSSCTSATAPCSHPGKDKRFLNEKLAGGHSKLQGRGEEEAQVGMKKRKWGRKKTPPRWGSLFQSNDRGPTMDRGENKLKKKTFIKAYPAVSHCNKSAGRFTSFSLWVCSPQTAWKHKESKHCHPPPLMP